MANEEAAEEAIDSRRRQRARLAQRAYRQRQFDTIERLEKELAALKDAVQSVGRLYVSSGRSELDEAVGRALKLAGAPPLDETRHSHAPDPQSRSSPETNSSSPESIKSQSHTVACWETMPGVSSSEPALTESAGLTSSWPTFPTFATHTDETESYQEESLVSYRTGRMSPGFGFGLSFEPDRFIHYKYPPPEIMHYVGEGEKSFAGSLFWGTAAYGLFLLQQAQIQSKIVGATRAASTVEAIFGVCFRIEGAKSVIKRMSLKMDLRRTGRIETYDHDDAARIRALVLRELARRGDVVSDYLSAVEVVDYIKQRCPPGSFESLNSLVTNHNEPVGQDFIRALVVRLTSHCVLFGDGPRFRVDAVDQAMRDYLPAI